MWLSSAVIDGTHCLVPVMDQSFAREATSATFGDALLHMQWAPSCQRFTLLNRRGQLRVTDVVNAGTVLAVDLSMHAGLST